MNYSQLKTEIAQTLNRHNLTERIPRFIECAEAEFNRELRCLDGQFSKTAPLYAGDYRVELPIDWLEAEEIALESGDGRPLDYVPPEQLRAIRANGGTGGVPRYYAQVAQELHFAPGSDADTRVIMTYYARLALSDAEGFTTNWLLEKHPDLYLYGALVLSAPLLYQDERVPMWKSVYEPRLESLKISDARAKAGSRSRPLRMQSRNLG